MLHIYLQNKFSFERIFIKAIEYLNFALDFTYNNNHGNEKNL